MDVGTEGNRVIGQNVLQVLLLLLLPRLRRPHLRQAIACLLELPVSRIVTAVVAVVLRKERILTCASCDGLFYNTCSGLGLGDCNNCLDAQYSTSLVAADKHVGIIMCDRKI